MYNTPWGILTGVRPLIIIERVAAKVGENNELEIIDTLVNEYKIIPEKARILYETYKTQLEYEKKFHKKGISLYISIPFCPSRCDYCSFVSHSVTKALKLIPQYLELLCEEISFVCEQLKQQNKIIHSVYIGGGTPTILDENQLSLLLNMVNKIINNSNVEYTIECGRPETVIGNEKLSIMFENNVNRISINPQTFNQKVLDSIGRKHTVNDIYTAFELAKGKFVINMDLIAGLPDDDFDVSLKKILELNPENITIHALSYKKGSNFDLRSSNILLNTNTAFKFLTDSGYNPYYIYRQKNTVGNLENLGYARDGTYNFYNMSTMGDWDTIIACGAGAITKIVSRGHIERIANYKYPYEYIGNFKEIINRKANIIAY